MNPKRIVISSLFCSVFLLTACFGPETHAREEQVPHDAPSGGQTAKEMGVAVRGIPGIEVTRLHGGGPPNIKGNTGYDIFLEVAPGYEIVKGEELVTFIVQSAWSVRDAYLPNAQISINVTAGEGSDFNIDHAAADAGWVTPSDSKVTPSGSSTAVVVMYEGSPARERLGSWPGSAPPIPTGVADSIADQDPPVPLTERTRVSTEPPNSRRKELNTELP